MADWKVALTAAVDPLGPGGHGIQGFVELATLRKAAAIDLRAVAGDAFTPIFVALNVPMSRVREPAGEGKPEWLLHDADSAQIQAAASKLSATQLESTIEVARSMLADARDLRASQNHEAGFDVSYVRHLELTLAAIVTHSSARLAQIQVPQIAAQQDRYVREGEPRIEIRPGINLGVRIKSPY